MTVNVDINIHFAHANGFPAASYELMLEQLRQTANVFAVDKFAHNPEFPLNLGWGNQVSELIHHMSENRALPCYLVGHSFGAVVSYMAACKHPDKVKGLIMLDPPLITGVTSMLFRALRPTALFDRFTPAKQTLNRCTSWPVDTDLVAYFKRKQLFKDMHPSCIEDYVDSAIKPTDNGYELDFDHNIEANIFRTIPLDLARFYGQLKVPGLLITGEKTKVCRPHLIAPFIKHNKLVHKQIKNGGHMFPLEQPLLVANMVTQQLAQWHNQEKSI
jgi:pimeloyl-ACP methyl ester carboxylesterase